MQRHHLRRLVGAVVGILRGQPLRDRLHFRAGAIEGDAIFQPGDDAEKVSAPGRIRRVDGNRLPELRRSSRVIEVARHHPKDGHRRAVDGDGPADDGRVAVEAALPERVTDHDDVVAPGPVLSRREAASQGRTHAQQIEQIPRNGRALDPLGPLRPDESAARAVIGGDPLEHRVLISPVEEVGGGYPITSVPRHDLVDADQGVRLWVRKGPQQHAVDDAEDRGRRADAERKRQDRHEAEARSSEELPGPETEIARDMSKHLEHSWESAGPGLERVGQTFESGLPVHAVGALQVAGKLRPIGDLRARVGVGLRIAPAGGDGFAIEVLHLRGQLAHDARLPLGRQVRQRQARSDERLPVTHRTRSSRR